MRVLIISPCEICFCPRLLKAADFFHSRGADITVYNAMVGLGQPGVYESVKATRKWKIVENDLTKKRARSRMRWLYSSLRSRMAEQLFKRGVRPSGWFPHSLNKGYVLFPSPLRREKFDFILIHLVDSLPFAVRLKERTGARLIYDCQEYFRGQYETEAPVKKKWVDFAEDHYAGASDIVLATTNVMLNRLRQDYHGPKLFLRVRNTPARGKPVVRPADDAVLKLVWHGFDIVPKNVRGVHILLEAVARCTTPVELFLQGGISDSNREILNTMLEEKGISGKVFVLKPAHPDRIVESLEGYDIGVAGELASQDNQRLTSSNKLFEYINAGLAVIVPDLPGLAETIHEYGVGELYRQGDSGDLAERIDRLNRDRNVLKTLKQASVSAASTELFWEHDYEAVWEGMQRLSGQKTNSGS
jgi:glycosyltransferase involved in cell wall biosynthesis